MKLTTQSTAKLTVKLFLIISLFCSTAFADGDMGSGNKSGDGSGGGLACAECVIDDQAENNDESVFKTFRSFFDILLG